MTWHPDMPESYRDQIVTGDARELAKAIPDESVDLVLTDPPYLAEYASLFPWLAESASRVLRNGGFLLTMVNELRLDQTMADLSAWLQFFFPLTISLEGMEASVFWIHGNQKTPIMSRTKTVLAYSKGWALPLCPISIPVHCYRDKRYHKWGQGEASFRQFAETFCPRGGVVWEPFTGGGTTPAVCKRLGLRYVAFELDPTTAEDARQRVATTPVPLPGIDEPTQLEMGV